MPLSLQDGYTLKGETTGRDLDGSPLPVVSFTYRPPVGKELSAYRYEFNAATDGGQQHAARVKFLLARIVTWNVELEPGKPANVTAETLDKVPDSILLDLVNEAAKWKPKPQEGAAGN